MRLPRLLLFLASLSIATACSAPERSSREETGVATSAIGEEESASPIFVFDSGHWIEGGEDGATIESFWVDLSVRNDAYAKNAGIVWTADGWKTSHTSAASFEGALGGGRERWGLQERRFTMTAPWLGPIEVTYAAFVTMNGVTTWSPFRNHFIYESVSPAKPVRLLSSSIAIGADGAPHLRGRARALNVATSRRVFVHYTVDAWKTSGDAEAPFDGGDFAFDVPLAIDPATTEEVTFALRLDTNGQSAWDAANGANYTQRLAPSLGAASLAGDTTFAAGGIRLLSGGVTTALPVDRIGVHIDGGPQIALGPLQTNGLAGLGFSSNGSFLYPFDSTPLADGDHTLAVEAAAGPFVRTFAPIAFRVAHGISYRKTWSLTPEATGATWDFARDARGNVYLLGERDVREYPSFDAPSPSLTFAPADANATLMDLDLDSNGNVYALGGTSLVRWLPTGAIDTSFGANGVLDFGNGTWGTSGVCYPANLAIAGADLFIVDSCNARVLRLTLGGTFVDELDLAIAGAYTNASRTFVLGDAVWVSRMRGYGSDAIRELVRLARSSSHLQVDTTITLDPAASDVDAFAIGANDAWTSDIAGNVRHLDLGGHVLATWLGGAGDLALPGALGIVKHIEPIGPSSIAVLSVDGGQIVYFGAP